MPPRALGAAGMLNLHRIEQEGDGLSATSPSPGAAVALPSCVGTPPGGWSMPNFTFQMGLLAPSQAELRVVKYFGKPCLSFSLKSLSLGKRRRAQQPA